MLNEGLHSGYINSAKAVFHLSLQQLNERDGEDYSGAMLLHMDEETLRTGKLIVLRDYETTGGAKQQGLYWKVWDIDYDLRTYPHVLYQWSTIGADNQLVCPMTRDIMIPGY